MSDTQEKIERFRAHLKWDNGRVCDACRLFAELFPEPQDEPAAQPYSIQIKASACVREAIAAAVIAGLEERGLLPERSTVEHGDVLIHGEWFDDR